MLGLEVAVVVATRVEGLEIAIVSPCGKGCDQRVDGKQYRKLHCLAMAASRNSSREQSNCVDRVACIFVYVIRSFLSQLPNLESRMWKGARDVDWLGHMPRNDPVLVPALERHRWIGKRSTGAVNCESCKRAENGHANLISLQLVYGLIKCSNINITGMLRDCSAKMHY